MDKYWEAASGLAECVENLRKERDRLIAQGKPDEAAEISRSLSIMEPAIEQTTLFSAAFTKH